MDAFALNIAVAVVTGLGLGLMFAWRVGGWSRVVPIGVWLIFGAPLWTLLFFLAAVLVGRLGPSVWSTIAPDAYARLIGHRLWRRNVVRYLRGGWGNLALQLGLCQSTPGVAVQQAPPFTVDGFDERGDLHALARPLPGQTVEQFERLAEALRTALGALRCRVLPDERRASCSIVWSWYDALAQPFTASMPDPGAPPETEWACLGITEDGAPWWVSLRRSTVTIAATGAGKGSVMNGLLVGVAPAIKAGLVQVHGIDLKGGMELAFSEPLLTRLGRTQAEAVQLLEDAATACQVRAASMAGRARSHEATEAEPLVMVVIDELAMLTAYGPDRDLMRRAEAALGVLLSTGRAVGYYVWAFLQDPRKEVLGKRALFPTAIALRLREAADAALVLGDAAIKSGATCHLIPASTPGVGYVQDEEGGGVTKVRAAYVTDDQLRWLGLNYPTPTKVPVVVREESTPTRRTSRTAKSSDSFGSSVTNAAGIGPVLSESETPPSTQHHERKTA